MKYQMDTTFEMIQRIYLIYKSLKFILHMNIWLKLSWSQQSVQPGIENFGENFNRSVLKRGRIF